MTDIKTILLIGRSGRGKSTLANIVTNTNDFKESTSSISETKKIQFGQFELYSEKEKERLKKLLSKLEKEEISEQSSLGKEDLQILQEILQEHVQEKEIKYRIIDAPGIGDTKMSDNEVLDIIAEAVYRAKDGISQVFFVNDGRFDQYEMATYDLLRTIIFDNDITKHTTIVRTRFPEFRDEDEWQADINLMGEEAKKRKAELEKNIFLMSEEAKKRKVENDGDGYQELFSAIEKAKKELTATNLAEIIESCQGRIVYVDNPSLEVENVNKLKMSKENRNDSREILLEYLKKTCKGEAYKPKKLKELSDEIIGYMESKLELEKELEELRANKNQPVNSQISEIEDDESKTKKNLLEDNKTKLIVEKRKSPIEEENKGDLEIISVSEAIAQLQDEKARLKKEIAEKEKAIRQKVLKHIFNNYQEISQELGGDIFLNSVEGDHNWQEIHLEFANKELVVKWLSQGFSYQQTKDWIIVLGNEFKPEIDADFCAWLRDTKKLTVNEVKRYSRPLNNIEHLRQEYLQQLKGEVGVLVKYYSKESILPKEKKTIRKKQFKDEREIKVYQKEIEKEIVQRADVYNSSNIVKWGTEEIESYSINDNEEFATVIIKLETAKWAKVAARIWLPTEKIPKTVYNLWIVNVKINEKKEKNFSITKIYSDENLYEGAFSKEKVYEKKRELIQQNQEQEVAQVVQINPFLRNKN